MRHVIIGDIHGNPIWERIVESYLLDRNVRFVFLGDYFDSFVYKPLEQIENFKKIYEFYKKYDCVLLMGNHDLHYLTDTIGVRCSGYNGVTQLLIDNFQRDEGVKLMDVFKYVYRYSKPGDRYFTCSHAGLTRTWLSNNGLKFEDDIDSYIRENISSVAFNYTDGDRYGESVHQGPLWVRPKSLDEDCGSIETQIVGHTCYTFIKHYNSNFKDIYYIDNFSPNKKSGWFLEINGQTLEQKIFLG